MCAFESTFYRSGRVQVADGTAPHMKFPPHHGEAYEALGGLLIGDTTAGHHILKFHHDGVAVSCK